MMEQTGLYIDPKSGFNSLTKTFHSVRPPLHLPQDNTLISAVEYAFSLRANLPTRGDSVALVNPVTGQRITYSDFTRRTKSLAAYLQKVTKLSKNDTAFILSPNSLQIPILYFSLLSLGVIVSPANPSSPKSEISHQIQLCQPVIAFATSSTVHKLPELEHRTILIDSSEFESMMMSSEHEFQRVQVSQSDLAAILYSSGTTGRSKGVMLTHRNLIAQVASSSVSGFNRESRAVMLQTTNMYFNIVGFFSTLLSVGLNETVVVNVIESFDVEKLLKAVDEFKVTRMAFAPAVMVALCKSDITDSYDLSSLEIAVCGGAAPGKDAIEAFRARFPKAVVFQAYGLTESTGGVFRSIDEEEAKHLDSPGRLMGDTEAKIVDPVTEEALPPRKAGELWIKGPTIMKGYVGDQEPTSATLSRDGWLRTGDLCYIDENGYLFIVDRIKELIKYEGFQVAPAELEHLLISHPEIADAAVIPYPDEESGELPMAFVVRRPQSTLNEAEIMHFVAIQVAPHKRIRRVAFINSIPRNAAGKILRRELKKVALPPGTS